MPEKPNWTKNSTFVKSTVSAASGFAHAVQNERKVRQILVTMAIVLGVCLVSQIEYFKVFVVIFAWASSLVCEIFNTALEKALDYSCGKEFHPLVKQGKDYAAACTFVSIIFASTLTLFVLGERYLY